MAEHGVNPGPLQGLERISNELQQERAKCTAALKDRARLKIEIEKLKQKNQAFQEELVDLREQLDHAEHQLQDGSQELNQSTYKLSDKDKEISHYQSELQSALSSLAASKGELQNLHAYCSELNEQYSAARNQLEDGNDSCELLLRQVQELQESNRALRSAQSGNEQAAAGLSARYADQVRELEDLRIKSRKFDTVSEKYSSLQQSSEEIRRELEETLRRNTALSRQSREAQELASARGDEFGRCRQQLDEAVAQIQSLREENRDILDVHRELNMQIEAHKSSLEAERQRSDDARVNQQYLDAHVNELRDAHASALQKVAYVESDLAAANAKISSLNVEVGQLREAAQAMQAAQREAESARSLSAEVEMLRGELTSVRKQLVRREVEDEANAAIGESSLGCLSSKAMSEREANSRKVYEGIIEDLRSSLDKAINEQYSLTNQLELARRKSSRVDQLEEEIGMYRDTVKLVAVENQSAVVSISESIERTQRLEHENQTLVRSLRAIENESRLAATEAKRLKEELQEEKKKHRGVHVDKLSVERKVAELNAERSRLENIEVDLKRDVEQKEYDIGRLERIVQELRDEMTACKLAVATAQSDGDAAGRRAQDLAMQTAPLRQRLTDAEAEVRALRETRATLQREIDMLNEVTTTHRRSAAEMSLQMDDMRREIQELQSSNETSRKSAVQRGNENAEQQIQMLRSDLMRTVSDWKEAERDRQIKEDASRRLQAELMKERDKSQLLQSQVSKLEERLLTANRELATFRGLDVYHAAKEAELATYRSSKAVSPRESVAPISKAPSVGELAFTRGRGEMSSRQLLDDWDRTPLHRPLRDDNQTAFERVPLRPTDLKGASEMDEPMSIDDISATDGAISQKKPIKIAGNVPKSSSYLNDDTEESDSEKATPAKSRQTYHRDARERSGQQLTSSNRQSSRSDSEDELEKERGDGRRRDRVRGIVAAKPSHIPEGLSASETDEVKETLGVSRKPLKSVANVSVTPAANRSAYKRPETSLDRYKSDTNTGEMSVHVNRFSSSASTPMQVAAYSSNSQLDTSAAKPVERVRPHRDVTYNPSKADFEKARQLLARTGRNR